MEFKPIFYKDKLRILNRFGTVGIVTLWSPIDKVYERLASVGVEVNDQNTHIAAMGNLYGEGFRYLLRNLLYNPQIDLIILYGRSRNESISYLPSFFDKGLEAYPNDIEYVPLDNGKEIKPVKIIGTDYIMDDLITPATFISPPRIVVIDSYNEEGAIEVKEILKSYKPRVVSADRLFVDAPRVHVKTFPSCRAGHTIIENSPLDGWKELVHRIFRFGKKVKIKKGDRIELQNVKVILKNPVLEEENRLREYGFKLNEFMKYQQDILSDKKDFEYTYGNRIRKYFGIDCLNQVVNHLKDEDDDRKGYISLWDNLRDMRADHSPCFVSLFFRKIENRIYLTATFRSHNVAKAWLENVYGLMALQNFAAIKTNCDLGYITVISHSITLDPMYMERMTSVFEEVSRTALFKKDPNGYFKITTSGNEIVVMHYTPEGVPIDEYRGKKPTAIKQKLYRNNAISDINHAMYIGMELQKAHQAIVDGVDFSQAE